MTKSSGDWELDIISLEYRTQQHYCWSITDSRTQYILATERTSQLKIGEELFKMARHAAGHEPHTILISSNMKKNVPGLAKQARAATLIQRSPSEENPDSSMTRLRNGVTKRIESARGEFNQVTMEYVLGALAMSINLFEQSEQLDDQTSAEAAGVETPYRNWEDMVVETFDETLVVTPEAADVGEWGLFSAPRVSETPTAKADLGVNVISMLGHRPDIDPSLPFVSSGIPAFDDDAGKPVSAFFVRVTNPGDPDGPVGKASLGFNFLNPSSPGQTSKNFVTGLNLGSTNNPGLALAQNELSGIQTTLVTLHAPDVFNERKEVAFHNPYSPANADINANPITALGLTEDLGTFDGYLLTLAGPQTHQKQTIQDPYVSPPEIP